MLITSLPSPAFLRRIGRLCGESPRYSRAHERTSVRIRTPWHLPIFHRRLFKEFQYARLTDALLRLRPFGTPRNSVGPDALGVPGPCFAARETSENLQMISQRRKRLAVAPAASDVRFSDCVKRLFRSGIGAATALRPQSRWGHALWPGGSWLPRLSATPYPSARRLRRLDLLALCCGDVRTFTPDHGFCQIKFFRWSHLRTDAACAARKARLSRAMATCLFESPPIAGLLRSAPARLPR